MFAEDVHEKREEDDGKVEPEGFLFEVKSVKAEGISGAATGKELGEACDAWLCRPAEIMGRGVPLEAISVVLSEGSGADHAHITEEDIEELWDFVES